MDDLSELAEVSLTSVGKIERGVQSPSVETLVRIATALDIDASSFISGLSSEHYGRRSHNFTARDFIREQQARAGAESRLEPLRTVTPHDDLPDAEARRSAG